MLAAIPLGLVWGPWPDHHPSLSSSVPDGHDVLDRGGQKDVVPPAGVA
jgi:hypothetical protein